MISCSNLAHLSLCFVRPAAVSATEETTSHAAVLSRLLRWIGNPHPHSVACSSSGHSRLDQNTKLSETRAPALVRFLRNWPSNLLQLQLIFPSVFAFWLLYIISYNTGYRCHCHACIADDGRTLSSSPCQVSLHPSLQLTGSPPCTALAVWLLPSRAPCTAAPC